MHYNGPQCDFNSLAELFQSGISFESSSQSLLFVVLSSMETSQENFVNCGLEWYSVIMLTMLAILWQSLEPLYQKSARR
jgi:hypothetical protein